MTHIVGFYTVLVENTPEDDSKRVIGERQTI